MADACEADTAALASGEFEDEGALLLCLGLVDDSGSALEGATPVVEGALGDGDGVEEGVEGGGGEGGDGDVCGVSCAVSAVVCKSVSVFLCWLVVSVC